MIVRKPNPIRVSVNGGGLPLIGQCHDNRLWQKRFGGRNQ
jgi:hypothetical protein